MADSKVTESTRKDLADLSIFAPLWKGMIALPHVCQRFATS